MKLAAAPLIPEVYLLWHPDCHIGELLAQEIYCWLRPGNGQGPQVFFRSLPAPGGSARRLPLPLPDEPRGTGGGRREGHSRIINRQVVIPLIDANMVADPAWRQWIGSLAATVPHVPRVLFPVALDTTAYNMPGALADKNYLRPAGISALPEGDTSSPAFKKVARSLLKQITEAMCRLILPRRDETQAREGGSSAKIAIFLSHAKADGTPPARRLRDYIYSQTQMAAFYDENDIAFGATFRRIIDTSLASEETAALIAVRSRSYASRPWCRRELSVFRRPQQEEGTVERWRLYPTLVVEALEGSQYSPGIAEMGNSPVIRWNDSDETLEEVIVTTVIRDAMLAAFHSAVGASFDTDPAGQIVISWLPDPTTLLHIPRIREGEPLKILYPGRGLSGLELDILKEVFPKLTFRSFEEALS